MSYIGNTPADKYQTLQKQSFTTSATDTYTLSYAVTNPQDLALFINNVRQNPNDAYSVSNTTLTLSSAITGSDTMYAVFLGRAVETVAPALSSVTNDMLAGSIANSKLANSSITLNGSAVSLGGSATIGGGAFESELLHVRDEKSSGTGGGTATANTDNVRVLNTILTNEITSASLSSNIITLPTGTYYINATIPTYRNLSNRAHLYNTADSSIEILGTSQLGAQFGDDSTSIFITGRFTISAQKTFQIRHYTTRAGSLGEAAGDGRTEVYTDVQIWKVA